MKATQNQIEIIESMVQEFSLIHNKKKRIELLAWYDLASGIKDIEITKQIMIDLEAI